MSAKPPRRRSRDDERPPAPTRPSFDPTIEQLAAGTAPVRSFRADPRPPSDKVASAQVSDVPRLHTDDLMAIAQMDPAEIAALMEGTIRRERLEIGAKVTGTVTRIGRDTVFVDVGGKSEGQIERGEFERPAGPEPVGFREIAVGDTVTAFVVEIDENGLVLSKSLSGQAAAEHLEEARATGTPVEGKVTSRNSGGFEVRIGSARAFCPLSLMSRIPEVDLDAYLGQTLQFRVIETGEKLVVNRRVLQEEQAAQKADEVWGSLAEGQQHRGIVRSVQAFGFFVDIGGVDGLVPRREISWKMVDDPRAAVKVGQAVEVVILQLDYQNRKITLSAKALEDDPWSSVDVAFHEGGVYRGTVMRAEAFGVFVELAPGLDGLVHSSKLAGGVPERGAAIDVRLLSIDRERHRLELAPVTAGEVGRAPAAQEQVRGTVAEVLRNGVVVQLDDGRTGWLPEAEVDLPSGTVLAQRFRRGKPIEARISRDDVKKPTLSMRAAVDEEERSWKVHQAQSRPRDGGGSGFGTFGDLLSKLKK
ncbi:MAG: S1 RNA-binding domain-containing protein [Myxococcota bacterium]